MTEKTFTTYEVTADLHFTCLLTISNADAELDEIVTKVEDAIEAALGGGTVASLSAVGATVMPEPTP